MGDLKVRFSEAELASIQQAAEVSGMTAEEFVRLAAAMRAALAIPRDRTAVARRILAGQKQYEGSPSTDMLREIRDAG